MNRVAIANFDQSTLQRLTASDRLYIDQLPSAKRRHEVAAWRDLLRTTLAQMGHDYEAIAEIKYSPIGAPYIVDSPLYIGVSHSNTKVAIIISDHKCAIDIEDCSRNFERVATRFTTPHERNIAPLEAIWSAKETLYKLAERDGLDLIDDIKIEGANDDTIWGSVMGVRYMMHYQHVDGHIVVHTQLP